MARQVTLIIASLDRFMDHLIKKLVLDIVANLVRAPSEGGTPVDTGWARSNWLPAIGAPVETTAGTREEAEAGNVNSATQQSGLATVAAMYTVSKGDIWITNNVPYIVRLNEGWSKQAPAGFVQAAIKKAVVEDITAGLVPRS